MMPDIYLYPGAANPSDIILRDPTVQNYFGVLRYWTGAIWKKAKLMVYTGIWEAKTLYRWDGANWTEIDTTGI